MRALIQRVSSASISIEGTPGGTIGAGYVILLGVGHDDDEATVRKLWEKVRKLRIFQDAEGKSNLSLEDVGGDALIVSQFTLYANCRRGNRPSYTDAGKPDEAERLYEAFVEMARAGLTHVETGEFGADMAVQLVNDGPFTIWLDTDEL